MRTRNLLTLFTIYMIMALSTVQAEATKNINHDAVEIDIQRQKTIRLTGVRFDELDVDKNGKLSLRE